MGPKFAYFSAIQKLIDQSYTQYVEFRGHHGVNCCSLVIIMQIAPLNLLSGYNIILCISE